MLRYSISLFLLAGLLGPGQAYALGRPQDTPLALRDLYAQNVERQLAIPQEEQRYYAGLLAEELHRAGLTDLSPQYLLLVDRSPQVQAILLFLVADGDTAIFIGASPVSTGRTGGFEYFETPTGVFDHNIARFDFRAEGTRNGYGIRGYGLKGTRVYDFGWVSARRTWKPGYGEMRFLIHSTDPDRLEPRLGTVQSKGCIRIPAALNKLIDYYGLLDAEYEKAMASGRRVWVLRPDRKPTRWPGRYLVVVDSGRNQRPDWSPLPEIYRPPHLPTAQPASAPASAPSATP